MPSDMFSGFTIQCPEIHIDRKEIAIESISWYKQARRYSDGSRIGRYNDFSNLKPRYKSGGLSRVSKHTRRYLCQKWRSKSDWPQVRRAGCGSFHVIAFRRAWQPDASPSGASRPFLVVRCGCFTRLTWHDKTYEYGLKLH